MSHKPPIEYLRDILHELEDVTDFTLGGKAVFMHDAKTRKAVIRSYEVIGEIVKRLPADFQEANPELDWRLFIGFRDFLAHHYEEVILENLWVAVEDVPNIRSTLQKMIAKIEGSES